MNGNYFIKLMKSPATEELLKYPDGYILYSQIAIRAWHGDGFNVNGLTKGEAFIGDYKSIGLTERRYRSAKKKLEKWDLATFRPTNKGTIAKITSKIIFDVTMEHTDIPKSAPVTGKSQASDERLTTNKEYKNKEYKKRENISTPKPPKRVRLTRNEKKSQRVNKNTPIMIRLGSIFLRPPDYLWSIYEAELLKKLNPSEKDVELMEKFYRYKIDPDDRREPCVWKSDLEGLLKYWSSQMDRARDYLKDKLGDDFYYQGIPMGHDLNY